jgi:LysM repeat protein/ABC-type branched-subunit amino acid transport system substrate-binding protein
LLFPSVNIIKFDPNYIYHKIEPKETLYALSQQYGIKIKTIKKYNKELEDRELLIGEFIKIPKDKIDYTNQIPKNQGDKYIYHKVDRKQTLYSISKLYNVEIAKIIEVNEDLNKRALITGEILKIPNKSDLLVANQDSIIDDSKTNIDSIIPSELMEYDCVELNISSERSINVALLIPFYTKMNQLMNSKKQEDETNSKEENEEYKIYHRSKIFIDMYQGCLLALNKLKEEGYNINLYVFDTEKDTNKVKELIYSHKLDDIDLFIGPMFSDNIELISEFSIANEKIMVSPFSVYQDFLKENPFAIQVSPDFNQIAKYASELLLDMPSHNYIIIHDGEHIENSFVEPFKRNIYKRMNGRLNYSNCSFQEVSFYSAQDSVFEYSLLNGKENIVIIPSSSQAFVSSVLSKLNAYTHDYEIKVLGMPRWRRFENIEPNIFHNLEIQLFSNYYLDYENEEVKNFIKQFRLNFKTEPNLYSYQAYDLFKYFTSAYNEYGQSLPYCINKTEIEDLLISDFHFKRINNQLGLSNVSVFLIFYNHEYDVLNLGSYHD